MSETITRKPAPPRRKLTHALAYTLVIALPLLALCYIAGESLYIVPACQPRPDLGITEPVDSFRQHGFPFVMMIDHKAACYEQAVHTYDWQPTALIADVVFWIGVAWICYWLLSGLGQTLRSLRRSG
jgi:hypothetical protein